MAFPVKGKDDDTASVLDAKSTGPDGLERLVRAWAMPSRWGVFTEVNNNWVGRLYIGTAFAFFLGAGVLALLMRIQLAVPNNTFIGFATYNQFITMHGTVMMFLFAVPVGEAFAMTLLPSMLGARDMPFPWQYWWEMSYQQGAFRAPVRTANELRVPVGEPVVVWLRSADVIHSFWIPSLAGKTDMIPGRVTRMMIEADRPGDFRGQCAEYCGAQHSLMAFNVTALSRGEFDAWLARLARPVGEPPAADLQQGRDLFVSLGCGGCHAVRGLSDTRLGPDLTQVSARPMIGAGTLPGDVGNIAGWIASAQHLKPGNAMKSYDQLEGRQLRALAAYLESLK